jgi:hypothetical protein
MNSQLNRTHTSATMGISINKLEDFKKIWSPLFFFGVLINLFGFMVLLHFFGHACHPHYSLVELIFS